MPKHRQVEYFMAQNFFGRPFLTSKVCRKAKAKVLHWVVSLEIFHLFLLSSISRKSKFFHLITRKKVKHEFWTFPFGSGWLSLWVWEMNCRNVIIWFVFMFIEGIRTMGDFTFANFSLVERIFREIFLENLQTRRAVNENKNNQPLNSEREISLISFF